MAAVLVVEDDPDIREAIAELLGASGYRVVTATNGREALAVLAADPADAIVLDLMMPEMDGRTFLRAKASQPALVGIPVVVTSAERPAWIDGVSEFLQKPFDADHLRAAIAATVPRARAAG